MSEGEVQPARREKLPLREASVRVVQRLVDAGHVAYFAGGCVRDQLLGIEPTDYDIATDATPERIASLFHRTHSVGESFGVMLVRSGGHSIQVATFRSDGVYSDHRHPDSVSFSDAEHDALRRDFTINGLFEDPIENRIIDFVNGRADLEARVIRAIGDPDSRMGEDRLRMLRAIRFAARFGFDIEQATAESIRSRAGQLEGVSRERIGGEIKRMLGHPNRAVAAWLVQYLGLDAIVFCECNCTRAPVRLGKLPVEAPYPTCLAAWLLDRGMGGSAGEDEAVRRWSESLVLSNVERTSLRDVLRVRRTLVEQWVGMGVAAQKRLASSEQFDQALLLVRSEDLQEFVDRRRRVVELSATGLNPEPFITGDDLIQLRLTPGPQFARLLDAVYDAQLEGTVRSTAEALELAQVLIRDGMT